MTERKNENQKRFVVGHVCQCSRTSGDPVAAAGRSTIGWRTKATASRDPTTGEESLVREALDRLGPRDREVLLLSEWEGLSTAERSLPFWGVSR